MVTGKVLLITKQTNEKPRRNDKMELLGITFLILYIHT